MEKSTEIITKTCKKCNETKSIDSFYKQSKMRDGYMNYCKTCTDITNRKWVKSHPEIILQKRKEYYQKDPETAKEKSRRYVSENREVLNKIRRDRRHLRYGISTEKYEEMLDSQNGKCAICKKENLKGKWKVLNIDHNHSTKKVRGLLCTECNTGLGKFGDNVELLQEAINYLIKNN